MTKLTFNIYPMLTELELSQKKRFSPGAISIAVKGRVSRQTVHSLLHKQIKNVNIETLEALLDFFASEGMPITVGDLFDVRQGE